LLKNTPSVCSRPRGDHFHGISWRAWAVRCHDHKYDPFSQKEFYQLFAYFNNVPEAQPRHEYGSSPPLILLQLETSSGKMRSWKGKFRPRRFLRRQALPSGAQSS
jgi:hypothetical protein